MKKRFAFLVVFLLFISFVLVGCGKKGSTLPPLGALAALPETRLSEALQGYQRDDLILGWGTPERSMDGNLGDVWNLDKDRELTALYDEYGKVFVITVKEAP